MTDHSLTDWDPRADEVLGNPLATYDEMRRRCPVAHSDYLHWSLFRHADVEAVLMDHQTFSNAVSTHVSVPNGMDPPEHTGYRQIIEPYFSAAAMATFEPVCRALAATLIKTLPRNKPIEVISTLAQTFALQVQCAFIGWPAEKQEALRLWMQKNQTATLHQDRTILAEIAAEFANFIHGFLEERRALGDKAPNDIITQLMRSEIDGRPLNEEEIISVLRNWTGGEVGTITAAIGILIHFLSEDSALQQQLRAEPEKLPEAIDEILRIHGPLMTNRRITTCPVTLGGRELKAGERLTLFWVSANRDEQVFEDAGSFRWGRDPDKNLLYGKGIHVCPGALLARLELRVFMEELLAQSQRFTLAADHPTPFAVYPASGRSSLHVIIEA